MTVPTLITLLSHNYSILNRHQINNLFFLPTFLTIIISLDINGLFTIRTRCILFHPIEYTLNMKKMIT